MSAISADDDAAYIAFLERTVYDLRIDLAQRERVVVGLETDLEQAELASTRAFMLLDARAQHRADESDFEEHPVLF